MEDSPPTKKAKQEPQASQDARLPENAKPQPNDSPEAANDPYKRSTQQSAPPMLQSKNLFMFQYNEYSNAFGNNAESQQIQEGSESY